MNWIKSHVDTVVVLGGILSSVIWMNGKFNDVDKQLNSLEKRLVVIETVMYVKGFVSHQLAANSEDGE